MHRRLFGPVCASSSVVRTGASVGRLGLVVAAWLCACDREAPPAPADAPESITPTAAAPSLVDPTPAAPTPVVVTPAPLPASDPPAPILEVAAPTPEGLPAFTDGKPIRLASLAVGKRKLGKRTVPTVAITDLASRAKLDEQIERTASGSCNILLALESAVAMRCAFIDEMSEEPTQDSTHFRVGVGGDVEIVDAWSFFHPGLERPELIKLVLHNPDADDRLVTLTKSGLELSSPWDDPDEVARLPWRAIAPYVRADGGLGPALVAEGLALAPIGTQMPAVPEPTPAIWELGADELMPFWLGLPAELRAKARLVTPGGSEAAGLVFAPGVETKDLTSFSRDVGRGYFIEPTAKLVLVRAKEQVTLRVEAGATTDVNSVLPAGTMFAAAQGTIDRTVSGIGSKHWSFVGGTPYGSWAPGRSLELAERCIDPPPFREGAALAVHGITELVNGGIPQPFAWIVYATKAADTDELDLHPVAGCTLQARTRKLPVERGMSSLHFTTTSATDGDSLIVVGAEDKRYYGSTSVLVFGPDGDAPIFRRDAFDGTIEVGATTGPDGAAGWFPVVLVSGKTRTWLVWNGTTLEARRAP